MLNYTQTSLLSNATIPDDQSTQGGRNSALNLIPGTYFFTEDD